MNQRLYSLLYYCADVAMETGASMALNYKEGRPYVSLYFPNDDKGIADCSSTYCHISDNSQFGTAHGFAIASLSHSLMVVYYPNGDI